MPEVKKVDKKGEVTELKSQARKLARRNYAGSRQERIAGRKSMIARRAAKKQGPEKAEAMQKERDSANQKMQKYMSTQSKAQLATSNKTDYQKFMSQRKGGSSTPGRATTGPMKKVENKPAPRPDVKKEMLSRAKESWGR